MQLLDCLQVEQPVEASPNEEGGEESSDDAGEDEDAEEQRPQIEASCFAHILAAKSSLSRFTLSHIHVLLLLLFACRVVLMLV